MLCSRYIASNLAFCVLIFLTSINGEAFAQSTCAKNLFAEKTNAVCADKPKGNRGLFAMYSRVIAPRAAVNPRLEFPITSPSSAMLNRNNAPAALPSVSAERPTTQQRSLNSELSHKGPNANATINGVCGSRKALALLVNFPGYPLFVGNQKIQVTILGKQGRGVSFVADKGRDFNELSITDPAVLSGLTSLAGKHASSTLTFKLKDQDGLNVKAKFDANQFRKNLAALASRCA